MKRTLIAVIILVVLCVGSLTAFFIVKNKRDKQAEEDAATAADYVLFSFDSDAVNKIRFQLEDGDYTAVLSDDKWQLSDTDEFALNNSFIQSVCTYMCALTAEKDYGEADDSKKAMYGLDTPTIITASDGTSDYTLYIGDISPTGDTYYVMTGEKNKIYAIDSLSGDVLKAKRLMLKNRYLLPYSSGEIANIQLLKNGNTVYDLSYNPENGSWSLPEEYANLIIDNTSPSSMVAVMTRLEAQEFLDENLEDYSKYGFDSPEAELIVTGTDGSVRKLLFSYNGSSSSDDIYVLFEESGQVATFYAPDADFIDYTPDYFLAKYVCNISLYNIEGFDLTYNGVNNSFNTDMNNNFIECDGKSISDIGSEAITAFTNFYNSIVYIEFETIDVTASPEKSDPLFSVNFHLNDGTDTLLELCKANDDSCYVFINGTYTGALVNMSSITGNHAVNEFYTALFEIISTS